MVLHYTALEELFEPVGIPMFGYSHISQATFFGIGHSWISIGIQNIIEFIHPPDCSLEGIGFIAFGRHHPFSHHLLYKRHLILRIHDIILFVGRDKSVSGFVRISKTTGACGTFFGNNFHDSCNSTWSIISSSRSIIDHSKAFNTLSCKSRNSRGYQ